MSGNNTTVRDGHLRLMEVADSIPKDPAVRAFAQELVREGADPNRAFREILLEGAWSDLSERHDALKGLAAIGASPEHVDGQGNSHLHVLAARGGADAIEAFMRQHWLNAGNVSRLREFVNLENARGDAALNVVAQRPDRVRHEVETLLEFGADPNHPDENDLTPLMRRAKFDDAATVEALIEGGADPDMEDGNGLVALDCAPGPESEAAASLPRPARDTPEI